MTLGHRDDRGLVGVIIGLYQLRRDVQDQDAQHRERCASRRCFDADLSRPAPRTRAGPSAAAGRRCLAAFSAGSQGRCSDASSFPHHLGHGK